MFRTTPTLLLATALALAGCMGGDPGDGGATDGGNTTTDDATFGAYPAPFNDTKEVVGSADPGNLAGRTPCTTPSSKCTRYPFTANVTTAITAALTWTQQSSDFDLYVFQDGQPHPDSPTVQNPPGTSETIEMDLEPGEYEVVVVAWGVVRDTYTLEVTFGPPAGDATAEGGA